MFESLITFNKKTYEENVSFNRAWARKRCQECLACLFPEKTGSKHISNLTQRERAAALLGIKARCPRDRHEIAYAAKVELVNALHQLEAKEIARSEFIDKIYAVLTDVLNA